MVHRCGQNCTVSNICSHEKHCELGTVPLKDSRCSFTTWTKNTSLQHPHAHGAMNVMQTWVGGQFADCNVCRCFGPERPVLAGWMWFKCGSDVVQTWFGRGSDVVRMSVGGGSDVFSLKMTTSDRKPTKNRLKTDPLQDLNRASTPKKRAGLWMKSKCLCLSWKMQHFQAKSPH